MDGYRRLVFCTFMALAATAFMQRADATNGVVGPGNCNEAGFASVLAAVDGSGGGTITFNCGSATFPFTSHKQIANAVTIDGGGTITFDGGNASGFFQVFFSANVVLKRLTFQHGAYSGGVRALENFGTLTLDQVRVLNNSSTLGALLNSGTLNVRWSVFSGNAANSAADGNGGAIENSSGVVRISASTFNGNSAGHYGGAIYSDSAVSIANSTFNANSATGAGSGGGAIYQTGSGDSTIVYATIVGNAATVFGGGLYNDGSASSTLTISRSILADNTNGNCDGVLISGGYNLWSGPLNCPFAQPGDAQSATLSMGPLANNGGPTSTMLPQAGNTAINHIPLGNCVVPVDQRGAGRPTGAGCDSGAVEVGGPIDLIFYDGFD
jgi:predicted outer membrane repeat protein